MSKGKSKYVVTAPLVRLEDEDDNTATYNEVVELTEERAEFLRSIGAVVPLEADATKIDTGRDVDLSVRRVGGDEPQPHRAVEAPARKRTAREK